MEINRETNKQTNKKHQVTGNVIGQSEHHIKICSYYLKKLIVIKEISKVPSEVL